MKGIQRYLIGLQRGAHPFSSIYIDIDLQMILMIFILWPGREKIVRLLLENGADINAVNSIDRNTPLHAALHAGLYHRRNIVCVTNHVISTICNELNCVVLSFRF